MRSRMGLFNTLDQINRKEDDNDEVEADQQIPRAEQGCRESPVEERHINKSYLQGKRQQNRTHISIAHLDVPCIQWIQI